jgi:glycogen debranching enzyme
MDEPADQQKRLPPEVDEFYIFESALAAPVAKLDLKHGETFLVCDRRGDFPRRFRGEFGFYIEGTRYVRAFEVFLFHQRPVILDAVTTEDSCQIVVELANAELELPNGLLLHRHNILIRRRIVIYQNMCYQSLWVRNFSIHPIPVVLGIAFAFDFADIFDVRARVYPKRGHITREMIKPDRIKATYTGLDNVRRICMLTFQDPPQELTTRRARYDFVLQPKESRELMFTMGPWEESRRKASLDLTQATKRLRSEAQQWRRNCTSFSTNDEILNKVLQRACYDLSLLRTSTPHGDVIYAGIPWFVAPFGRDGLITGIQTLILNPGIARDMIRFLRHYQGTKEDDFTEEEPGKILHEYRKGELANLRQIPFIPYYGCIDATPLYLIALEAYVNWTGDLAFLNETWSSALAALHWIDNYGDRDGDGFVEYRQRSPKGLRNQGWKDSYDSVFHEDGSLAEPPIALAEVQGYVYAAKKAMADLAALRGEMDLAHELLREAQKLKEQFNRDFWWPEEHYYYMALDGEKRPCRVISSNPAHGLWSGIIDEEKAPYVARKLMEDHLFSGWGIRTLSLKAPRYNPLSYHNGSVWPHENALIAMGLRRYGLIEPMKIIISALFQAACSMENQRLPELFGGFSRTQYRGPTPYPLACQPQAWASGSIFMMIQAMLGLEGGAINNRLVFRDPALPSWIQWVEMSNLKAGSSRLHLMVHSGKVSGSLEILEKEGDVEVVVIR